MVCSPTVATIIESIPGFASNSDGDAAKMRLCIWCTESWFNEWKIPSLQKPIYD